MDMEIDIYIYMSIIYIHVTARRPLVNARRVQVGTAKRLRLTSALPRAQAAATGGPAARLTVETVVSFKQLAENLDKLEVCRSPWRL